MTHSRFHILLLTAALLAPISLHARHSLSDYVDPMIGTALTGHTFPGAAYPFGMIQLSPDTDLSGWEVCSGYHYDKPFIYGFTHTHLCGTGCADLCDVLFLPVDSYPGESVEGEQYRSEFSHDNEYARAGYYRVTLDRWGTTAELTTGRRAAMHHYLFPTRGNGHEAEVVVDLTHRDALHDATIEQVGDRAIQGFRRSRGWASDHSVYFYAEFSKPIVSCRLEHTDAPSATGSTIVGPVKALLSFGQTDDVYVRIAISSVSAENARLNLRSELKQSPRFRRQFRRMHASTRKAWEGYLSKIAVTAEDRTRADGTPLTAQEQYRTFYTALYHTAIAPSLFSDVNGEYRAMDGTVRCDTEHEQYTVFSIWDTFRALHPLYTLIERERTQDFLRSFLDIYRCQGKLPVWELHRNETNCMIGYNSVSVIADALQKGIRLTSAEEDELFEAMLASAATPRFGIDAFHALGHVEPATEGEAVSKNLEYAYDDWCIAQTAGLLGCGDEEKAFRASSLGYQYFFDDTTKFIRPRINGEWLTPFDPQEVNHFFTEANSWQYNFFVPHDISGHIRLMGGDDAYAARLDGLFSADERTYGSVPPDITGFVGQYAQGNEPSHHVAYLFNAVGRPWRTAEVVRTITDGLYGDGVDGLCGNDDCGQMSAWYIFSTLGFYPVCPGDARYAIGTPHFRKVQLNLEDGTRTTLCTDGDGIYVQGWDDGATSAATRSFLTHDQLMGGGTVTFHMDGKPSATFGTAPADRFLTAVEETR